METGRERPLMELELISTEQQLRLFAKDVMKSKEETSAEMACMSTERAEAEDG